MSSAELFQIEVQGHKQWVRMGIIMPFGWDPEKHCGCRICRQDKVLRSAYGKGETNASI